jgi:glycosyltransferase involved in cell wall biosynthesis
MLPVTSNMGESLRDLGFANQYEVVPNVVDIDGFSPANTAVKVNRFIHLSTLNDRTKNISGMMRAVRKLAAKRNDFCLDLIGIEEIDRHIAYARELGIYDSFVNVYPQIEHHEVPEQLRRSRCLLMFSNFESLPCVIIEAMASGIPVISSHVGGIPEYLGPKEGILVEKGDEEALAKAMNHMLDHFSEFDPVHLRQHAEQNFSPESISRKLDTIYQSIPGDA